MVYKLLYLGFKMYCFLVRPIRMGVRVLMVQGEKIWLVRHTYMDGWFLPGGGLKKWETLEAAARREALEETGAELGALDFVGVFTSTVQWKTDHTAVFHCSEFKITGKPDAEISEARTFNLSELPGDLYTPYRRLLEQYQTGGLRSNVGMW